MSLLDDVSIVVTPNGYKAGELYAVVPVPTYGAELVTNGDFATDSDWTKGTGVTIGSNVATFTSTPSGQSVSQNAVATALPNGSLAKVSFEVLSRTEGSFGLYFSGTLVGSRSSVGVFTAYFTKGTETSFYIRALGTTSGTISNVSVIQETKADMDVTRATAATRVDENGLVNYAEIIGSEEVVNGDFATDLSGWTITGNDATHTVTWTASGARFQSDTTSPVMEFKQLNLLTSGKQYVLTCNIAYTGVGQLRVNVGTNLSPFTEGANTKYFSATSTTMSFLRENANVDAIISNVSVKEVTRDNVPRIDYTGGGCPHILAEPQRTNLITYSSDFTNSSWANASIGTTPVLTSGFISPDGTNNAYKISNANQDSFLFISGTAAANDSRTIYARTVSGTGTAQLLSHNSNTNNTFNLTEEWQRFKVNSTTSSTGEANFYAVDFRGSGTLTEFLIYGSQLEIGSYPTSYIPTSGSTVTRNQDQFTRDGIGSLINSTEGVLFVEMAALVEVDANRRFITLNDGGASNNVVLRYEATGVITARYQVGGVAQCSIAFATTITNSHKIAFKYKENDFALWVDGTEVGTDTSGSVLAADTINKISFDSGNGSFPFYGKVKQLQVFKTALTDSELATLTTQ